MISPFVFVGNFSQFENVKQERSYTRITQCRKVEFRIAKTLSIARSTVWKTLKGFTERGDLSDRLRCGRSRSQRSKSMIRCIRERIRRNARRTMRLLAKTANMSPRTVRRLVHENLKMSSYTLQKRQTLSGAVKQKRLERSSSEGIQVWHGG